MTQLIFVRHGKTSANVAGRWQGWSECPLTPFGCLQANAVARRLASERAGIAALYTSPLRRAVQTARTIGAALRLHPLSMDGLREINFGELSGVTLEGMEAQFPKLFARWKDKTDMEFKWPQGERRSAFFRRVAIACDRILLRHPHDSVVIVAHGGTLRACLAHLLPDELGQWWAYSLDNCGLTWVRVKENEARLLVLNDGRHLPTRNEEGG